MALCSKSHMRYVDRAHAIVMEDIAAEDWHEQLLVSYGCSCQCFLRILVERYDKQDELIKFAS
jgi:hypothetical protein